MKMFNAECPHCGSVFQAQEEHIGKRGKCPQCGETFTVEFPADNEDDSDESNLENMLSSFQDPVLERKKGFKASKPKPVREEKKEATFSVNRNFSLVKFVALAYAILGGLMISSGAILFVLSLFDAIPFLRYPGAPEGMVLLVFSGFGMVFAREMILLQLAIEENTHITAIAIQKISESAPDS